MLKISREEKKIHFIYLLMFWLFLSSLFCYVCFHNYSSTEIRSKELIIDKIHTENAILKTQFESAARIDSLEKMLLQYQPSTNQVSLENNIDNELKELKEIYEAKKQIRLTKCLTSCMCFTACIFSIKKPSGIHQTMFQI